MAIESQKKWEGKFFAKVTGHSADEVWPLLEDFFNIHKWIPALETCHGIEGVSGQRGCVRYCAANVKPSEGSGETTINWAMEKLVAIDPVKRCFSYEIIDSSDGFTSYEATMNVLGGDNDEEDLCKLEWSFAVDPVEGWKLEDLISFYSSTLEIMAKRMEEALQATKQT
ncbi:hypothetical protein HHK36_021671 [Tetracentron sinense]|uniref:Lachrymatory factor synthase n=1 Tax=Tetracentron sinense TaxID=13715 RepID=A0A834YXD6_TETSI|nr:hypothetical protein HHK36_021671 [Tetracentron sinense]